MLFGITIRPVLLALSGTLVTLILVFQFLQGKRIIKFKGARHRKVHATAAWFLLVLAIIHGLIGYAFWLSLQIG